MLFLWDRMDWNILGIFLADSARLFKKCHHPSAVYNYVSTISSVCLLDNIFCGFNKRNKTISHYTFTLHNVLRNTLEFWCIECLLLEKKNCVTVTLKKHDSLIANCKAKKIENRLIVESETDTRKVFLAPEMFLGSVIWHLLQQFAYAFQYVLKCFWFTKIPTQKQVLWVKNAIFKCPFYYSWLTVFANYCVMFNRSLRKFLCQQKHMNCFIEWVEKD